MAAPSDRHKQLKSIERSVNKLEAQFWDALNDVEAEDHMLVVKNKVKQIRTNKTKFDKLVLPPDLSSEDRDVYNQVKTKLKRLVDLIEINLQVKSAKKLKSKVDTKPEAKAKPRVKPREKLDAKPDAKPDAKLDASHDTPSNFRMFSEIMHRMGAVE